MNVGIIAEYNPFHKGHAYQIQYLREHGASTIAVVMSGDFVQRGAPAWADKYLRARMALVQGVDFVFELPVLYSLSSAEGFASGGVSLLSALPLTHLCFGSECTDLSLLEEAARLLMEEPSDYRNALQEHLRQGMSFPAARQMAFCDHLSRQKNSTGPFPSIEHPMTRKQASLLLSQPNNILAIEYLKAIRCQHSPLIPIAIQRKEGSYHDTELSKQGFSSASAIRHRFEETGEIRSCLSALPEDVYALLRDHPGQYSVTLDDFSLILYYTLRKACESNSLSSFGELTEELAHRIQKYLPGYHSLSEFILQLKTKNITYSRISRSLFQLLLGISPNRYSSPQIPVPYLRLLGLNPSKSSILRKITKIPVITKVADAKMVLTSFYSSVPERENELDFALKCFSTDVFAADLYRQILQQKQGCPLPDEYHAGILRHSDDP